MFSSILHDEWELFDLEEDPTDQVNLYGKAGYEGVVKDLKLRLAAPRSRYQVLDLPGRLISLALWASRLKKGHNRDTEDYFLAGKSLPWYAWRWLYVFHWWQTE